MIAEHDNKHLQPSTLNTISAAKQLGQEITCLVAGDSCKSVSGLGGAECVWLCVGVFVGEFVCESVCFCVCVCVGMYMYGYVYVCVGMYGCVCK